MGKPAETDIQRFKIGKVVATYLFLDLLSLSISCVLSIALIVWSGGDFRWNHYVMILPMIALSPLFFALVGLYPGIGLAPPEILRRFFLSIFYIYSLIAFSLVIFRIDVRPYIYFLIIGFPFSFMMTYGMRTLLRHHFQKAEWWGLPVVILGSGITGKMVIDILNSDKGLGYRPVAAFDDDDDVVAEKIYKDIPIIKGISSAREYSERNGVGLAILAMPGVDREKALALIDTDMNCFPQFIYIPNLFGFVSLSVEPVDMAGILAMKFKQSLLLKRNLFVKRIVELAITLVGGIIAAPFIMLLVALVRIDSKGSAFYGHRRLGAHRTHFKAWKFRSMVTDGDKYLVDYLRQHPEARKEWNENHKLKNDPRITRVGRVLRATSLDELPQIWNVIRGEMSLIGPRPIVDEEIEKYGEAFELFNSVRPGLTGLWQVSGRSDTGYERRIALDSYYVRNWSLWIDLYVFFKTFAVVLFRKGAY